MNEKPIFQRKDTIQVFTRKKQQDSESLGLKRKTFKKYDQYSNPGKIYINEFWSDKYAKKILKVL